MSSVNKVILVGHLGRDPEVRYMPNGAAVCNVTLATSRQWKNKDTGEKMEETEWHRCSAFDRIAEVMGEYLKKGRQVYIEGRLKTRKWTDKDGVEKYTTEVIVEEMKMLGAAPEGGGQRQQHDDSYPPRGGSEGSQRRHADRRPPPAGTPPSHSRTSTGTGFDDMDDDIPF